MGESEHELVVWLCGVHAEVEGRTAKLAELLADEEETAEMTAVAGRIDRALLDVINVAATPAALRARVEAERAHLRRHYEDDARDCPTCGDAGIVGQPCPTLRLLAAGWRHMPGWRDEWAPPQLVRR